MNGGVDRAIFLAFIVVFATSVHSFAQQGSQEAPPGLPAVIESLGSGDPPDLPPGSDAPPTGTTINDVQAPFLRKPVEPRVESPRSSVLDTLDNLPPVGTGASPSNSPSLPDLPSVEANGSRAAQVEAQPRIVRFGDVRTESVARQQFPELRNRGTTSPRINADNPAQAGRTDGTEPQSRGLLARLFPWRRQPPPEPPLVTRSPADERSSSRPGVTASADSVPGTRNRAVADRIDQELRKKVDRAARQAVGSRTNELDIQVIDEEVYIRARPMWFWQRRQITDELRNLPGFDPKRLHVTVY